MTKESFFPLLYSLLHEVIKKSTKYVVILDLFVQFDKLAIIIGNMQAATTGSNYSFFPRFMKYRGTNTSQYPPVI